MSNKFLKKYDSYYDKRENAILFERILTFDNTKVRTYFENHEVEDKRAHEKLLQWLPKKTGEYYLRVYHKSGETFRQKAYGRSWDSNLKKIVERLIMKPDENNHHELVNINEDAHEILDYEFGWRIKEWRTRVTESISKPFTSTKSFPEAAENNLLCDYITWVRSSGETVVTAYGWNAYKNEV